jgi:hypothetical protein
MLRSTHSLSLAPLRSSNEHREAVISAAAVISELDFVEPFWQLSDVKFAVFISFLLNRL